MILQRVVRRTAVVSAALGLLACLAPTSYAAGARLFTGGGYALDAAGAVQAAIEDAENSAGAEQLYTCELVGEPQVFVRSHPRWGVQYTAEATVGCTP